ncbi:MAG: O-antigen/teichoic acid export membrane protein, partial [Limisphaerales bacterium]
AQFYALAAFFIIPKTLFKFNIEALRGLKEFGKVATQNISLAITNLTVLVILTVFVLHKYVPVYGYLITMLIVGSISTWLVFKAFGPTAARGAKEKVMKWQEILQLSAPMFMTKSAFLVLGFADVLMITAMRDDIAEVGYYQVAWKLIMFNKFFKNSITSTAAPKLAELHSAGNFEELKIVAKKTTMLLGYTVLPFIVLMVVFGKPMLRGLYGAEFLAGYQAFMFLGLAQIITAIMGHVGMFMNMCGGQALYMRIVIFSALMNIGLNYVLIPIYGITGAAVANVASVLFTHIAGTIYIKRNFGFTIAYPPLIGLFRKNKF